MIQQKRRGRPSLKNITHVPSIINFDNIVRLKDLNIDPKMLETMKSGLPIDVLLSTEGGIPCASNYMMIGDPGVGKNNSVIRFISINSKQRTQMFIHFR